MSDETKAARVTDAYRALLVSLDEWFAAADNLLNDDDPFFDPSAYCEQGKVMDGWESRRRREAGYDWCVLKLSTRALLYSVTVDTAHFTGNHVPAISLQAADLTYESETAMVAQFPGIVKRLLHGCIQGTGATPLEVAAADKACYSNSTEWTEVLPKTPLQPGYEATRLHHFPLLMAVPVAATHVRLNYYPDGGVARLRLYGLPHPSQRRHATTPLYKPISTGVSCTVVSHTSGDVLPSQQQQLIVPQVSCVDQGGVGVTCSNQHYGNPSNLIQVTSGVDMGDGWETARHPNRPSVLVQNEQGLVDSDLSDWCILKLGRPVASVARIILDTKHFRGNYPESVQVEGCYYCISTDGDDENDVSLPSAATEWFPLLARGRMAPDSEHCYDAAKGQILNNATAATNVSHVRIRIYPDGGLSRVRIYGEPME